MWGKESTKTAFGSGTITHPTNWPVPACQQNGSIAKISREKEKRNSAKLINPI